MANDEQKPAAKPVAEQVSNAGWGMFVFGLLGGAVGWHYASKAMQNYGRNRSIDDRMNALDAVYQRTIPGATQPRGGYETTEEYEYVFDDE